MFDNLTGKLQEVFKKLSKRGKLSEADVDEALREVRLALLEADVHFKVVKEFIARVRVRAVGAEVGEALNPAQQVIKIVHEELLVTLGTAAPLDLSGSTPHIVMLVGLQGSGKTTFCGKLAKFLKARNRRAMLVEVAFGMIVAVEDIALDGPLPGVAVNEVPEAKRASHFQLRLAPQQADEPIFDINVVGPNPNHLVGAPFVDRLGGETCHGLRHHLAGRTRRG